MKPPKNTPNRSGPGMADALFVMFISLLFSVVMGIVFPIIGRLIYPVPSQFHQSIYKYVLLAIQTVMVLVHVRDGYMRLGVNDSYTDVLNNLDNYPHQLLLLVCPIILAMYTGSWFWTKVSITSTLALVSGTSFMIR